MVENFGLLTEIRYGIAPANEAVKWEVRKWHSGDSLGTAFTGEPRPELEDAWNSLLGSKTTEIFHPCLETNF
jgi:hypothetical protein